MKRDPWDDLSALDKRRLEYASRPNHVHEVLYANSIFFGRGYIVLRRRF
jgi:hypothetical protein